MAQPVGSAARLPFAKAAVVAEISFYFILQNAGVSKRCRPPLSPTTVAKRILAVLLKESFAGQLQQRQLRSRVVVKLNSVPSISTMPGSVTESNLTESQTRAMWRAADCVCFDVDSTVCMDEAIDELARFSGREKEVAELTNKAMRGGMTFKEALELRLELIQPTARMLQEYIEQNPPRLSVGIEELVAQLQSRGVAVYLVSGGFRSIIEGVADEIGIPRKNIFANQIKFYFNGEYAGYDEKQPTTHQDGKARVVSFLKQKYGYQRVVMVGDGATDLAACPPADAFIGYGGNQVREKVKKAASWFVYSFDELVQELNRN
ncbi:phosphoserine phosphatase isoform X1 [Dermacentor albipictus]|uniref:phosphoserine phosphatase isoform X1 n=1 Tax=Dermacentor albipictus TaxID=60249 RepID=UPI0031FDEA03